MAVGPVSRDTVGRTIIQLAVDDWALERLMTFDAADLEEEGDAEPDDDAEEDGAPVWLTRAAEGDQTRGDQVTLAAPEYAG